MDIESFLQKLDLPINADIDPVERAFMERLKERLQQVTENYDEAELRAEEGWLHSFIGEFFGFSIQWVNREAAKYKDIKEFDSAPKLKKEAKAVVADLQKYIIEFASCYMHLNRFMTLLREEIRREEIRMSSGSAKNIRWTADSGAVIARYRKEKIGLLARTERMGQARALLEKIEDDFDLVRKCAIGLFGKDKAEPYLRRLNASVRVADFTKARKAVAEINEAKKKFGLDQKTAREYLDTIDAAAGRIIDLAEQNQSTLMSEDNKLYLRPLETDLAYNADIRELQKIKGFLAKYHLPYMQYKLDTLGHLKDKLLVINSLESLMTLYKRLIMGIAYPLRDIKAVRLYESEILNNTKYLLTGHFTELPKILQRAEETVAEFRDSREELKSFEQLDLQEIQVAEQQTAQA